MERRLMYSTQVSNMKLSMRMILVTESVYKVNSDLVVSQFVQEVNLISLHGIMSLGRVLHHIYTHMNLKHLMLKK